MVCKTSITRARECKILARTYINQRKYIQITNRILTNHSIQQYVFHIFHDPRGCHIADVSRVQKQCRGPDEYMAPLGDFHLSVPTDCMYQIDTPGISNISVTRSLPVGNLWTEKTITTSNDC